MRTVSGVVAGLAGLAIGLLSAPLSAATFWVSHTGDSGTGSLRQAIIDMNAAAGDSHQIWFDLTEPGQIWLSSTLPAITKPSVLITGFKSPNPVVIVGGAHLVFHAPGGLGNRNLSIAWLAIEDLEVDGSWPGCIQAGDPGGAQPGTLTLLGVTVRNCRVNSVHGTATGGAVLADARHVSISNSLFDDNLVEGVGGALVVRGGSHRVTVTITGSTFTRNGATGTGQPSGGAMALRSATLHLSNSRFFDNWTRYSGAGPTVTDGEAAIIATESSARIANSLFFGNESSRGVVSVEGSADHGPVVIENSQFIGNEVGRGSVLAIGSPRGIVRNNLVVGTTTQNHVFPTAVNHQWLGSGPEAGLSLHNNMLLASNAGADSVCRLAQGSSPLHSQSDNLVVAATTPGCHLTTNTTRDELAIEALRDNGGPVETVSLFADSAAIDAGNPALPDDAVVSTCLPTDARGVARAQPGSTGATPRCDVGAWESQGEPPLFRHDFECVLWRP